MHKLIFLFLMSFSFLQAHWETLLKPCEGRKRNHKIGEIDFIYMINLKERPEKWDTSLKQLLPFGIYPYRFDAINGWKMDKELFQGLGCPELAEGMTPGKVGCLLSQLSVLKDAYDRGFKTIWLMEDDIQVYENPNQLSKLIPALDKLVADWDILYTDPETKGFDGNQVPCLTIRPRPNLLPEPMEFYLRRKSINKTFTEIGMRYGCYSMIIRQSGIKKILDYFTKYRFYLPLDMELFFIPRLKQIVLNKDLISTRPGIPSDTGHSLEENDQIKSSDESQEECSKDDGILPPSDEHKESLPAT